MFGASLRIQTHKMWWSLGRQFCIVSALHAKAWQASRILASGMVDHWLFRKKAKEVPLARLALLLYVET